MALLKPRNADPKPPAELSDKALRQRISRAERTVAEINAADSAEIVRAGKADESLARMEAAVASAQAAKAELARRAQAPKPSGFRVDTRSDAAKAVYSLRNTLVPPELNGETLNPERLSEAEGKELRGFIERKLAHGDPGVALLDAKEEGRFEQLVGKAAGDEGLFARKRKERDAQEKIAAAKEKLRIAALPRRFEYAEPGSIALPRFVFDWLQNPATGSLDLPILGALIGLLFSFENQKPIIARAVFEQRDDELVLVCSGPFDQLRFTRTVNPNDGMDDFGSSGRVKAPATLRYLIRNKWLTAAQEAGTFTVRLGERAKRLREGTPAA